MANDEHEPCVTQPNKLRRVAPVSSCLAAVWNNNHTLNGISYAPAGQLASGQGWPTGKEVKVVASRSLEQLKEHCHCSRAHRLMAHHSGRGNRPEIWPRNYGGWTPTALRKRLTHQDSSGQRRNTQICVLKHNNGVIQDDLVSALFVVVETKKTEEAFTMQAN